MLLEVYCCSTMTNKKRMKAIGVRFPYEVLTSIEKKAEKLGIPRSILIRSLVIQKLNEDKKGGGRPW